MRRAHYPEKRATGTSAVPQVRLLHYSRAPARLKNPTPPAAPPLPSLPTPLAASHSSVDTTPLASTETRASKHYCTSQPSFFRAGAMHRVLVSSLVAATPRWLPLADSILRRRRPRCSPLPVL